MQQYGYEFGGVEIVLQPVLIPQIANTFSSCICSAPGSGQLDYNLKDSTSFPGIVQLQQYKYHLLISTAKPETYLLIGQLKLLLISLLWLNTL